MKYRKNRSITVEVDVDVYVYQFSDSDLVDELEYRGYTCIKGGSEHTMNLYEQQKLEIIEELKSLSLKQLEQIKLNLNK